MENREPLHEVKPEPIKDFHLTSDGSEESKKKKNIFGIPFIISPQKVKRTLRTVQKHSVWPLVAYFPLHGINTLIIPLISPENAPDDALMMVRELLPSITSTLLTVGIGVHLLSGVTLRIWKLLSPSKSKKRHRNFTVPSNQEPQPQREIGLTGGLSGYFIGINKQLNYSPQIWSGYLLAPAILYHLSIMKWIPRVEDVEVGFDFIKWILQNDSPWIKWVGGYIPYSLLIIMGCYHICAGICQYTKVRKLSARRKWTTVIFGITVSGILGLFRLAHSTNKVVDLEQYHTVMKKFYLL